MPYVLGFQGPGKLDSPFGLQFADSQECRTHDGDDDACQQGEDAFPDFFCAAPFVGAQAVEGTDQTTADDKTNAEANEGA